MPLQQVTLTAKTFEHTKAAGDSPESRDSTEETCPNDSERCNGPDDDELPCFGCYEPDSFEEGE